LLEWATEKLDHALVERSAIRELSKTDEPGLTIPRGAGCDGYANRKAGERLPFACIMSRLPSLPTSYLFLKDGARTSRDVAGMTAQKQARIDP